MQELESRQTRWTVRKPSLAAVPITKLLKHNITIYSHVAWEFRVEEIHDRRQRVASSGARGGIVRMERHGTAGRSCLESQWYVTCGLAKPCRFLPEHSRCKAVDAMPRCLTLQLVPCYDGIWWMVRARQDLVTGGWWNLVHSCTKKVPVTPCVGHAQKVQDE